ncbi:MAG TPA: ATP-binding cassette domain-containing protein [Bacillota bacterium]|nr:ATP-binding cassette domain-containing protein [Bacillota bacterium]
MSVGIFIKDLVQTYGGQNCRLDGINLEIRKGEFIAIVGQNGAGKTTLVKHLNGLLRPDSGSIYVNGSDISCLTTAQLSQKVGYVFQNPDHQIFMDRVDKEIAFGPNNLGLSSEEVSARVTKAIDQVGLTDFRSESPLSLSKGQRQRVAFASILAMEPEFLILDEPTTGQDAREAAEIMELVVGLNQKGHTIIFITHDMQLVAKYAKRVILMKQGRILADGTPREVLTKTTLLAESFLKPPQITLLAQAFSNYGFPEDIISVEELLEAFQLRNMSNQELLIDAG